jgi:ABC-type iron transport system FetAB ATPase subunit
MSRLKIDHLTFRAGGPIDLEIGAGECVTVTGPSGTGKSLLLRALADLDPHGGQVWLDEAEATTMAAPAWRRQIGMLPAESGWWRETVGEHFAGPAAELLEALGLPPDVFTWEVGRLSTGERQRLGLARLLANRPRALLLDEPTASLDAENTRRAEALIARYRREAGAATLWVSHDPAQIARIADRCFRLTGGLLVAE